MIMVHKANTPSSPQKIFRVTKLAAKIAYLKNVRKVSNQELGRVTSAELQHLGPTFIKIGQFMSTRSDVFGKEFTQELRVLQDMIPPVDMAEFEQIIPASLFSSIQKEPLASASIGQVHYARLQNGEEVVIKLKRPNIEKTIRTDFFFLMNLVRAIQTVYKDRQTREMEILLQEYYQMLLEEIDFEQECNNMEIFAELFRDKRWLKVPKIYKDISSQEMIVMEYVPSIKINNLAEFEKREYDTAKISEKLIECYLAQIVDYGYVHIDPHPGNVGMTEQGQIVFYDYGMVLSLDMRLKTSLRKLLLALYDRDIDRVCDILTELDIVIVEPGNMPVFKKFVASFLAYIDNLDIQEFKASYIDRVDASEMPFLLSSKFLMLLRGLSLLEGVCRTLNPEFNYRMILDPYINELSFDIEYIERRGNRDLMRFRNAPDKIALNEISVGILEKDVETLKQNRGQDILLQKVMGGLLLALIWVQPELSWEAKMGMMALTFLAISK